jgi:hypothetical protein
VHCVNCEASALLDWRRCETNSVAGIQTLVNLDNDSSFSEHDHSEDEAIDSESGLPVQPEAPANEIAEIVEQFEWFAGKFEREAVAAAVAHREAIIPELLRILEEIADPETAADLDSEGGYMAHIYAMFLLAQFRETRAYPLMLRIALLPSDLLESLFGDCTTSSFDSVFASICGGDVEGIQSLIENESVDEWVRGGGLGALVTLVAAGIKSREEILDYFASLFHGGLKDRNDTVWSELVAYCADLYALELLPEIEKAYQDGLVDPGFVGLDHVKEDLAKGLDWAMARLAESPHRKMVDDTAKEMEWWASFNKEEQRREAARDLAMGAANVWQEDSFTGYKRSGPKIGRNDPCPCGSGKKYKKCCGG